LRHAAAADALFRDLSLGMTEALSKVIDASDVVGFAEVTGDRNPIHLSEHFARRHRSERASRMGFIRRASFPRFSARDCPDQAQSIFRRP
jgi:acyl dehydratase